VLNRKKIAIFIIILSLLIAVLVSHTQFVSETILNDLNSLFVSESDYTSLSTNSNLTTSPLTTEIYFNGQKLLYDPIDNIFYYSLVENDPTAYSPQVELTDSSISLAIFGKQISNETIAANTHIKLFLISGNKLSLSDLVCTTLPIMNISIDEDIISANGYDLTYDIETDVPSSIYLFDNRSDFDGTSRTTEVDCKIHKRGQTNSFYPSKSYKLTLLEDKNDMDGERAKENLLGLREDDDWILYSPYRDYEKIRNVFSMNLWYDSFANDNEWNVANGTQYKYIELFINGHYHGLYGICYPIDKKQVNLQDSETLFKKTDWTHSEKNIELEYSDVTGEYILPGYSIKDGTSDGYNDLLSLYVNMTYSMDTTVVRLTSDVTNSIDLWLYYKLTQAVDNVANSGAKNMFVSTKNSDSGIEGHKLLITPWDMDQTWRYVESGEGQYSNPAYDLPVEWGTVYTLLELGDSDITTEIKSRYAYLRANAWSDDAILSALSTYQEDIYDSGAFLRTQQRWPEGLYNDARTGLSEFTDYVLKRLECMDAYIEGL